jgi:hypothetical protein
MDACTCGERWVLASERIVPAGGRWLDDLVVKCRRCDVRRQFRFDVSTFFSPRPGVWNSRTSHVGVLRGGH